MPSPRSAAFVDRAPSLPRKRTGPALSAPPQSPGLPPAHRRTTKLERLVAKHPAKPGRMTTEAKAALVEATLTRMDTETPREIALSLGVNLQAKPIKEVIRAAREALARRAMDYVDLHFEAAQVAASEGNAKPIEWALERISEGGERIVDSAKAPPPAAPTFNLGFVIGGVPQQALPAPGAPELPVLAGTAVPVDMP